MKKIRALLVVPLVVAIAAMAVIGGFGSERPGHLGDSSIKFSSALSVTLKPDEAMQKLTEGRVILENVSPTITKPQWDALYKDKTKFQIYSTNGFARLSRVVNDGIDDFFGKTVYLVATVVYTSGTNHEPIGAPGKPFKGTFDGGSNIVTLNTPLNINNTSFGDPIGFFGVTDGATIMNLEITGNISTMDLYPIVGGIIGSARNTTLFNCINKANVATAALGATVYAGGIVGYIDDSSEYMRITNCINHGTISVRAGGTVASIIPGFADASNCEVRVCVNFGKLLVNDVRVYDLTACPDCSGAGKINCEDCSGTGEVGSEECEDCDGDGEVNCERCCGKGSLADIREWGEGSDWDLAPLEGIDSKTELLREFNDGIHESKNERCEQCSETDLGIECVNEHHAKKVFLKHDWRRYKYEHLDGSECHCLWARFWGFIPVFPITNPVVLTDEITIALPRIYYPDRSKAITPVLDVELMLEFRLKDLAASQIFKEFSRTYSLINSDDNLATVYQAELIDLFWDIMAVAQTRSIHETSDGRTSFPEIVEDFLFNEDYGSDALMDGVYWRWYEDIERIRKQASIDLVVHMMVAWFEDCLAFIDGNDDLAIEARRELHAEYKRILGMPYDPNPEVQHIDITELEGEINEGIIRGRIAELVQEAGNSTKLSLEVDRFIHENYLLLDGIYFGWEFDVMLIELEESYYDALAKAGGNNAKVEQMYLAAKADIEAARDDESEKWTVRSAAAWSIQENTLAEFDALIAKWEKQRMTTIWISVTGGLLLLAAGIVTVLLLVMRKREIKYNSIVFDSADRNHRKEKRLSKRADVVSRANAAQRERADEIAKLQRERAEEFAKIQREKTEALAKIEKEKRELQLALQRSAQAYAEAAAKTNQESKKEEVKEKRKETNKDEEGGGEAEG